MRKKFNINTLIMDVKRSKIIGAMAIIFSLLYHFSFLIVFFLLKVYPMFYFNIFSVSLFFILALFAPKFKSFGIPYITSYFEVLVHQILADHCLGGESSFHFFILLMGGLAFVEFEGKLKPAAFFGFISAIIFSALEIVSPYITPIYEVSKNALLVIKSVNIVLSILVIVGALYIFTYIVWRIEINQEFQIIKKTKELEINHQNIYKLQDHIIYSLASLVENRDTDTGEHIQRTSAYVEMLAKKCLDDNIYPEVINAKFVDKIKRAAPMHDIGKIIVPDAVLKKPGKLTDEEFEMMKLHTTEGSRIINEVVGVSNDKKFVKIASEIASGHHERWDGTGYPNNLKGEEIPVSARIMAIADVFDALVSPRVYKNPMSQAEAIELILEEKGTHFDPILIDEFLAIRTQVFEILNIYKN